jgi:DNA-binding beta-propeller fold protein YncE
VHWPPVLRRNVGVTAGCVVFVVVASADRPLGGFNAMLAEENRMRSVQGSAPSEQETGAWHLRFVREFSSADDVQREMHPIADRSLNIIAGPAGPHVVTGKMVAPQSVVTDSKGRVFVSDSEAGVVHVFDFTQSRYSVLRDPGGQMHAPGALAVDREDHIYVADTTLGAILVFDAKGRFVRYLGKGESRESWFESPLGIAVQPSTGRVYICDSRRHMILVVDKKGRITAHLGARGAGKQPGEFRYPARNALAQNELYVIDSGNQRLEVLDLNGRFRREFHLEESALEDGLAVDEGKNIYVSDAQLNTIRIYDQGGRLLAKFGQAGIKEGEFDGPSGLWIESGNRLYVADQRNHRVQMFEIEKP